MPKTQIKKKTNTTGGFQDLGYTLTEDEITKISEIDNKINKITSTDNAIARFDGTTGAIQNSKVTIDDSGVIYSNSTKVALTSDLTNVVKTTTTNTFTANNIFKNNAFEIRANSSSDDSWIKLTNATDSGYYAFGIRRPYDMYGLQMKIHPDTGNDQYIDILHAGNYTKYAEPAFTKNTAFNKNFGTTSGTVCQGNDSRLSNARTPTAHTHTKSEITDFPTISTVNNGTLTIQKNGTNVQTFTANQSSNVTANITVPTKTSDLTNDSGFITSADLPTGGVTSVVGQTGAVTAAQIKTGIQTSSGGFAIGANNPSATTGGAIGKSSKTAYGGAVGESATASTYGGAVGYFSNTTAGGAIGGYAQSTTGFAGGYDAKATADGAVQLGTGTNSTANTLNFRTYKLLNANGYIPFDRLQHIASTHLDDLEFTTIFEGDAGSGAITIAGGKSLCNYRIIFILGANDARNGAEWKMYYGWQFREMASNTLINSVVLSTSHTTGGWLIKRDSLTSTTTLTQTEENMRVYAIYGMN